MMMAMMTAMMTAMMALSMMVMFVRYVRFFYGVYDFGASGVYGCRWQHQLCFPIFYQRHRQPFHQPLHQPFAGPTAHGSTNRCSRWASDRSNKATHGTTRDRTDFTTHRLANLCTKFVSYLTPNGTTCLPSVLPKLTTMKIKFFLFQCMKKRTRPLTNFGPMLVSST